MNRTLSTSLLSFAVLLGGTTLTASAQNTQQTAPQQQTQQQQTQGSDQTPGYAGGHRGHHRQSPERETRTLSRRLGLNSQQTEQIQPILVARQQKMEALHQDSSLTPQQMHAQRKSIMADTDAQLNQIFNAQQQQQFAQMKAEHHHHGYGQNGQSQPAPGL